MSDSQTWAQQRHKIERWYRALPKNDQRSLKILTVFLAIILAVYVLILPAQHYFNEQVSDYREQSTLLNWMESKRNLVASTNTLSKPAIQSSSNKVSLLNLVTTSAKQKSIDIKRFEPQGETELRLFMDNVDFDDLLTWLMALDVQGVEVEQLTVDRGDVFGHGSVRVVLLR